MIYVDVWALDLIVNFYLYFHDLRGRLSITDLIVNFYLYFHDLHGRLSMLQT
jgi:hypothetical protein